MLKIKSQIKSLGLVIGLGLLSGTASAISIYDTTEFSLDGQITLKPGDWAAGRFTANSATCINGCDVTDVTLSLFNDEVFFPDDSQLTGLTLSVYSDGGDGKSLGSELFGFDITNEKAGADISEVSISVINGQDTHVAKNTFYWLRLGNVDHQAENGDIAWNYDSFGTGEYQISSERGEDFASDIPLLFELNGIPAAASPVPVPGAAWMMASGLFGLLGASRRKSNKLASAI